MAKGTEKEEKDVRFEENLENVDEKIVKEESWQIKIKNNPDFCGVGAGGVQFANGRAVIHSERMAQWFMEHDGYEVTEM